MVALPLSLSGHSPEVSLFHFTSYLFTSRPELVQERWMVVAVVETTVTSGAATASMKNGFIFISKVATSLNTGK